MRKPFMRWWCDFIGTDPILPDGSTASELSAEIEESFRNLTNAINELSEKIRNQRNSQ